MSVDQRMADKVVIVTGAGQGIGSELVRAVVARGGRVVGIDRNADALSSSMESYGNTALALVGDVTDPTFVAAAVDNAVQHFGAVHGLVNNAGIIRPAMLEKMTLEQWNQVVSVHMTGSFLWVQAVGRHMISRFTEGDRLTGSIINVSSIAGLKGSIGQTNYSAAKAGQLGITMSAAREWARYGIRVNAVCFGVVETPMTEIIRGDKFRDNILAGIPLGYFALPEDVVPPVCFLLSDEARYVTGQHLSIDGGAHISL